ncbi:MurR/RpiR family transcriptional regulator [Aminobacterium colombiense]|uniref:Transcriptional regulator, RpiR family n=1 Tax=Aminobacterium colombiense (strain DSM 12261 / ALA-1) TaxID=572547 RepID=D5EHF3_AMICL|nr:MurR/RpiR family transcriptional regulator [Aminobacterium colombiense]ADE57985.1 transcriptional regulator, RpiR family [Aminobacterium colombiense DSM 12261]
MLRERITAKINELSPGHRKVARFILEKPREAAFLTASQLGAHVGVSEATVIRFAYTLGLSGYQELHQSISHMLIDDLSTLARLEKYRSSGKKGIFGTAMDKDINAMKMAQFRLDEKVLLDLAKTFVEAPAVYIAGYRSSYTLAYYLSFYLSWLLPAVKLMPLDSPYELLVNAPRESVVVGISFPRYSTWTVDVLRRAQEHNLKTVAITDEHTSPLANHALHILAVPYSPISFIDSFAAPMSVLNCIILSISQQLGDQVTSLFETFEQYWKEQNLYEPPML